MKWRSLSLCLGGLSICPTQAIANASISATKALVQQGAQYEG
ncbi:hypothetical protein [Scytonema sp. NUACC21]